MGPKAWIATGVSCFLFLAVLPAHGASPTMKSIGGGSCGGGNDFCTPGGDIFTAPGTPTVLGNPLSLAVGDVVTSFSSFSSFSTGAFYLSVDAASATATPTATNTATEGKPKVLVKGKGANLPDPIDTMALSGTVTAQVINADNGNCWEDSYMTFVASDTQQFKAKKP